MATPTDAPASVDETLLIRRAQAGEEEAFELLLKAHHAPVFRLVLRIVRREHDARDVCQDVWVTVWKQLPRYRGDARFSTWLHAIAVRRSIDHLRKRRRWFDRFLPFADPAPAPGQDRTAAVPEPIEPGRDARGELERGEQLDRFERVLASLPPRHRSVLALREIQGLSYEQMADVLQCRPGTVMSRLFHARRLLARKLQDFPCD